MAPDIQIDHAALEAQLKGIIQKLYELMCQVYWCDVSTSRPSREIVSESLELIHKTIEILHSSSQNFSIMIPQEVIQYVDDGRNPDIYTREFVELARRQNQMLKGKQEAFASFRDILATQMWNAMPELRNDIKLVVDMTGGNGDGIEKRATAGARIPS